MTAAMYAMKPGTVEYGVVCPECAGPKHRQSKRCAACYRALRRSGAFPAPPRLVGSANGRWKASGHTGHRATGASKGRQQPLWHPWRKENALLFMRTRALEMVDEGVRPATAGGRMRAHFAATDEAAA